MMKFKGISLAQAKTMSESTLRYRIGMHAKYLREELGMDENEVANFVTDLLNMGVAMNEKLKEKKTEK